MQNYFSNPLERNAQRQNYINNMVASSQINDPYQRYVIQQDIRNDNSNVENALTNYFENKKSQNSGQSFEQLIEKIKKNQASASDYRNAMLMSNPDFAKQLQTHFAMKTNEENKNAINGMAPIVFALKSNNIETAKKLIDKSIQSAQKANDMEDVEFFSNLKNLPAQDAANVLGGILSLIPEGENVLKNVLERQNLEASALDKQNKAKISGDEAAYSDKFYRSKALKEALSAEGEGFDTNFKKNRAYTSGQEAKNSELYYDSRAKKEAYNATGAELENYKKQKENQLKSIDLKYKEEKEMLENQLKQNQISKQEYDILDQQIKDSQANENRRIGFNNTMQIITNLESKFKTPAFERAFGPVSSKFPTVSPETADIEAEIDTLRSAQFLQNIEKMRGFGALSNDEGRELRQAIANLSLKQSPESGRKNIIKIKKYMMKMENAANIEYAKRKGQNIKIVDYK